MYIFIIFKGDFYIFLSGYYLCNKTNSINKEKNLSFGLILQLHIYHIYIFQD